MERLQKFLSRAGVASRRAAEVLILEGQVKVNGVVVTEMGTRVDPDKDLVVVGSQPVTASAHRQYFLLYKPPGVVTTLSDPQGRATVADFIQKLPGRVYPVGRLDFDAEGALLLTDDGELANQLMHPSHQVPRVYLAKVKGEPDQASLDKLVAGVRLEDGMARAVEVRRFEVAERNTWLKLVVTEGRQHLVKRLCAAIGHPVVRLFRPAHAGVSVHGLKPGQVRPVSERELAQIRSLVAGGPSPELELFLPGRRHGHGFSTGLSREEEVPEAAPVALPAGFGEDPLEAAEDEAADGAPDEPREYYSKRGPDPVERQEKPAAVGRARPPRKADDRGGPPSKPAPPRPERSRFAPKPPVAGAAAPEAAEEGESAIEAPRRREPGAFGRGGKRPDAGGAGRAPDGRIGKAPGRARYGTSGPRDRGQGGRFGKPEGGPRGAGGSRKPPGRFEGSGGGEGAGGRPAGRFGGPRREGPSTGARTFGGPRREGPSTGARTFGGPRREGPSTGARTFGGPRREGPSTGARTFGGPSREGPSTGARTFGGPRREGPSTGARTFGGPRRDGPSTGPRSSGGPRREGPGGGARSFGKPAGRFGASGPRRDGPGGPRRGPGGPRKPGGPGGGRPGGKRPPPRR